jgi:energy-coupling factor transport system substrate-specific component
VIPGFDNIGMMIPADQATVQSYKREGGRNRDKPGDLPIRRVLRGKAKVMECNRPALEAGFFIRRAGMNLTIKKISLVAAFIALGVTLGYAFITIPNVEMVTATIFIAGYMLGVKEGMMIGLLTEFIYSLFNPYGAAAPPLLAAQVIAMGFTGFLGGFYGNRGLQSSKQRYLLFGLAGLLSTLVFAILTTLSFISFTGLSLKKILASLIYGLGFYVTHMISNTIIFIVVVPVLIQMLLKVLSASHPVEHREIP